MVPLSLAPATGSDEGAFLRIKQSMDDKDGLGAVVWHCVRNVWWIATNPKQKLRAFLLSHGC